MSWPRENEGEVWCIDFPQPYLSMIKTAVERGMVKWGKNDLFMGMGTAEFEYAGCTWELVEMNECVTSITLLKGKPSIEDFTFAALKGKIETS
jgi:hypothetical protein